MTLECFATLEAQVDALIAPFLEPQGPGVSIGVTRHGEVLLRKSYGLAHIELGVPLTPDLNFPICSITKQMASLCALVLANEGLLDLEAPIGTYVPELPEIARRPALTQLMTHQSGLRCFVDATALDPLRAPRPERFGLVTLQRLDSVNALPGAWQVYCPSGHYLLSLAMERVTGMSFNDLTARWLFEPLGLRRTRNTDFPRGIVLDSPSHYEKLADGRWTLVTQDRFEFLGEGGVYSTVDDLLAWAAALRTEDSRIPKALWRAMKTVATLPDGRRSRYGLGLQRLDWRGVELLGHGGGCPGVLTFLVSCEALGIDVVVLANGEAPAPKIAFDILALVAGEANLGPPPVLVSSDAFSTLAGAIFVGPRMIVEFVSRDGLLLVGVQGNPPQPVTVSDAADVDFTMGGITTAWEFALRGDTLEVHGAGEAHECWRLPTERPTVDQIAHEILGTYEHAGLGARYVIARDGERLTFEYLGRYGFASGEVLGFSPDLLRLVESVAVPYGFNLRLTREGGQVTGFDYETSRTRALPFRKIT